MGRPLRPRPEGTSVRQKVSLRLPADVFDEVAARAQESDRTLSQMITHLLRRAFEADEE
jgi:hypothetical protein